MQTNFHRAWATYALLACGSVACTCVLIHAVIGRHHNKQFSNISDVHGFVSLVV